MIFGAGKHPAVLADTTLFLYLKPDDHENNAIHCLVALSDRIRVKNISAGKGCI